MTKEQDTQQMIPFSIRLPIGLDNEIEQIAEEKDRTKNKMINIILKEYADNHRNQLKATATN